MLKTSNTLSIEDINNFFEDYLNESFINAEESKLLLDRVYFEYNFDLQNNFFRLYLYGRRKDNKNIVMKYVVMVNENRIYIDYDAMNSIALPEFKGNNLVNKYMLHYLLENTTLKEETIKSYNKVILNHRDVYKKDFEKKLDRLIERIGTQDIINITSLVHVTPLLRMDSDHFYLSLKIGRDKEYIILKIGDFINRIKKNVVYRYGKDLEFIHSLSIFDECSQKLISIVEGFFTLTSTVNAREISITAKVVADIFKIYKDKYISINDRPYFVRMNKVSTYISVDADYVLHAHLANEYMLINGTIYLMNDVLRTIDVFNEDKIYVALFQNIINSPFASIEDKIDDFKYTFILRYPDNFIFDKSIENDFDFDTLQIKAYFDFNKDHISLKTELWIGEEMVEASSLNKFNLLQYDRYNQLLSSYGFNENKIKDQNQIWNFLSSDYSDLKKVCSVYLAENILNKNLSSFRAPQIKINLNNNMLDVFLGDSIYSDEELLTILNGLKQKKKYVLLNNRLVDLSVDQAKDFYENVEALYKDKNTLNKPQKLPIYYAFKTLDDNSNIIVSEQIRDILADIKDFKKGEVDLSNISADVRTYQADGVKWLKCLYQHSLGGILADEMGLGKTLEVISFISLLKEEKPVLIVCPKSLLFNWKSEFNKFFASLGVTLIYGDKKNRVNLINHIDNNRKHVYITGYESLRLDEKSYKDKTFGVLILDEGQAIKNSESQRSISLSHIHSVTRFILTGTPIENSVLDLWSLFNFLMPNYFPEIHEFKTRYENDDNYAALIKKKVAPFILRRIKKDVLSELPPKYDVLLTCDMSSEQRKVYDAYRLKAKNSLLEKNNRGEIFSILMRLRQICITPSLFVENYSGDSGKLAILLETIHQRIESGHKILIFSQFVKALEQIETLLQEDNISYSMITGDTKAEDRLVLCQAFNKDRKNKVMLLSLKAGGNGLNLTGADVIIHLDPWWNVAAENQATDRAHRIGQERNVEVIKLICENSIEERVLDLQEKKKELISDLINENDSSITSLSLDDISYLLG